MTHPNIIRRPGVTLAALAVLLAVPFAPAQAEEDIIGSDEYLRSCAGCHGVGGRGNGRVAEFLTIEVPDLTKITERNDGQFPLNRLVEIIDGRADVRAHGERPMPIWGQRYSAEAAGPYQAEDFLAAEQIARGRILELVNYLQAIQQPGGSPFLERSTPQTAMEDEAPEAQD